jgi:hypothetical protein
VLRLTFHAFQGEHAVQARARSFRLCADATLRGHDNSLAATRVDGVWRLARRSFKWFDCAGPVFLIVRRTALDPPLSIGPFKLVRAGAALLWGDEELLWPRVPGWADGGGSFREVSFVETIPDREESLKASVTHP